MVRPVRVAKIVVAVALVAAPAACSDDPQPAAPEPSPPVSASASSGPFASLEMKALAADIVLSSCIPRFNGERSDWCDGVHLWELVTGLTTDVKRDITAGPDPARFAAVSAAITDLETTAGRVKQHCAPSATAKSDCTAAFDAMMADWRVLRAAAGWSRK